MRAQRVRRGADTSYFDGFYYTKNTDYTEHKKGTRAENQTKHTSVRDNVRVDQQIQNS